MDRASKMVPAGILLGAAALAAGLILPHSAPRAAMPTDGVSLFTPGLGCGPTETQVGTVGLLARVRAEAATAERRRDARRASRPSVPSLRAKQAPVQVEQEPRAAVLRSFYTCDVLRSPNLTEGTGWRLVGPLRQS